MPPLSSVKLNFLEKVSAGPGESRWHLSSHHPPLEDSTGDEPDCELLGGFLARA